MKVHELLKYINDHPETNDYQLVIGDCRWNRIETIEIQIDKNEHLFELLIDQECIDVEDKYV